ncbi:5-bromo-4-chloroindolyl phosphate hydrolysis family protein [Bacillus vallismortis]|uniref:5-bromo-4-chloroindolyl phosphate hydrolysis family protein n=1 Tax=Bacillus vallismortis TaxID=72361 RepID=UPI00227E0872|nr:5-bromo-4-chloroindolyl phosphate hydrolysis family protein [Bacillus vallismortis]MCY7894959.1 5-bromo-4-chloroindolyl phosphate hydrolysis family protein [Bacillus vallismortis]MCY7916685.1 5-bromo-4-chloroindolyl phosphate hydrolysis family protein [Bacillus vallismortis]MCY8310404.1 5-bromo-4-chloroindolyl phosphate hydrolysis family protein [Bacillus vallismortis]MCY8596059.1 5-bromo-4-chloroindolyl phosphate hydrolysis family protein [Bacillus vallismortis]MEC1652999.1 5-bromo-4-chlor
MQRFLHFLIWSFTSSATFVFIGILCFFGLNQPLFLSFVYGLASGLVVYTTGVWNSRRLFLKKHGLTGREYAYIKKNLEEARHKIIRLRKALFQAKSIQMFKQNAEMLRLVRRIYILAKKEPKRFYQAERFFYQTLDSVVELTEKYAFLSSHPKKSKELSTSLSEARITLAELTKRLEEDLTQLMGDDIDELQFELDAAKHSLKK